MQEDVKIEDISVKKESNIVRKKWQDKFISIANAKYKMFILNFVAFIEASFFPIPPETFMIPMVMSKPKSWKRIAFWVSLFSILGAFLGYYIGFALFENFGSLIIEKYDLYEEMIKIERAYNKNAFLALLTAAFTPIPFKLFTIASGVFKMNLLSFALACIIGRGARYLLVSYITYIGGRVLGEKYLKQMTKWMWIFVIIVVCVFLVILIK